MHIGIFDSGIGGLTVARAIQQLLPHEAIIYFGDTAHLPYGDQSAATIQAYALSIADYLVQRNCKVILIACNSASVAAYELVKEHVGNKAMVFNVIDPVIDYIRAHCKDQVIGLIGTRQTVQSGVYEKKIHALQQGIQLQSLATPRLAPMIEAGFTQGPIHEEIIESYLHAPALQQISALILGCTHYPIIKKQIQAFYQHKIPIIDAPDLTAHCLKYCLMQQQLLSTHKNSQDHFMVSKLTAAFESATQIFFAKAVNLELIPGWS